jgi:hypothetical protein
LLKPGVLEVVVAVEEVWVQVVPELAVVSYKIALQSFLGKLYKSVLEVEEEKVT